MICIFDCETIPDADLIRRVFDFDENLDDYNLSLKAINEQEAKNGSSFLPLPYHKVVAISAVIADDLGRFVKVSSIEGENEKEMIKNFLNFIDSIIQS